MIEDRYSSTLVPFCIHGLPRSGTSWLGEIFNSHPRVCYKYQPLFSYALKEYINGASSSGEIEEFFDVLQKTRDPFLDQDEARSNKLLPVFEKETPTHVAYKEVRYHYILPNLLRKYPNLHIFLLVRDPRSTIHSWWKSPKEFRADLGWEIEHEWRYAVRKNINRPEEYNGFERWKEAVRLFVHLEKAFPHRVTLIRYSDLLIEPEGYASNLFQKVQLNLTEQTSRFLEVSGRQGSSMSRYSVFRTKLRDDEWRSSLPNHIADEIRRDVVNTQLEYFLDEQ